ncbi:MAG: hypothetical protein K8T89_08290 [Planctomycetes bacterium]|nr:hypothetical protein [Planctomycetota bacterium]
MPAFFRYSYRVLSWLVLLAILVIGVPIFICMPLWVDTTYHDISARNILWGGVHYRDVFETNLPGMVWLHAIIRPIVGWSSEAIRCVDLIVVSSSVLLLGYWLRRIGATRTALTWFFAACAMFYLFETEFIHCQRDSWMLLPTILAMQLRGRQLFHAATASRRSTFARAMLEGMAWGSAIWIKPHCVVPAALTWLISLRRMIGTAGQRVIIDFLGLLTGGMLNPEYYKWTVEEMDMRVAMVTMYFAPWSLIHFMAVPVAFLALIRMRVWRLGPIAWMKPARLDQGLLAALYLGWVLEAVFLQKVFHYSQAPVIVLAIALLAAHRVPVGPILISWCLVSASLIHFRDENATLNRWLASFKRELPFTFQQVVPWHRLINDYTLWSSSWKQCVMQGSSPELKDRLSFYANIHCAPNWTELEQVKKYLETLNLKDGELVCWDDTTHPLYLDLKLKPSFRFMHVNTSLEFRSKRPRMREELIATGHKYVVSDVNVSQYIYYGYSMETPPGRPLDLPVETPCFIRDVYPWNQPVIFKYGRYWVHRIENPITEIRIPYPRYFN